jgi:molecular chaperone Hsp33
MSATRGSCRWRAPRSPRRRSIISPSRSRCPAWCGILVQHLPEGEEGRDRIHTRLDHPEWEHVRILAETTRAHELFERSLPLDGLLWRLFHEEEVRVVPGVPLARGCRCSLDHIRSVIARFPGAEREQMVDKDGVISVDCEFCSRLFPIPLSDFDA